jgi:hypothetical protein
MSKEIDKLIEQVLSEKTTLYKVTDRADLHGATDSTRTSTLPSKYPKIDAIKTKIKTDPDLDNDMAKRMQWLFRAEDPKNVLDTDDLAAAFTGTPSKATKAATWLKDNSTIKKVRQAAEAAFQDSDAYEAWWDKVKNFEIRSSADQSGDDDAEEDSDPKDSFIARDEKIIPGSKNNIARVIYLFSAATEAGHPKQSEAKTTLEAMVQEYLGGIRLVQDYIGTEHPYSQKLIKLFKNSDLKTKRLPYKDQDQSKHGDKDKKDVTTTTISDPALSTGGSADAAYRQELIDVFQNVAKIAGQRSDSLDSSKFWIDSLKHIAEFSSFVKNKGKKSTLRQERMMADSDTDGLGDFDNMTATDYLTMTVALDYCYRFAKEIEGGGGAYQFEAFLGLLAGGYVGGKERGIAGGPGEADFVIQGPDGKPIMGSAKFYASDSASQSARSFELNEGVAYVYAKKYGDEAMQQTTSDALEIMKIGLHIFTIEKVFSTKDTRETGDRVKSLQEGSGGEAKRISFNIKDPSTYPQQPGRSVFKFMRTGSPSGKGTDGALIGYYECESKGQIALKPGLKKSTIVGVLDLPKVTREELTAAHQAASSQVSGLVRQVFDGFKDLMGDLTNAKKLSTQYSTGAKYNDGLKALLSIESAGDKIVKLSDLFVKEEPEGREGEKLQRMKESQPALDQLIEIIIKQTLLK